MYKVILKIEGASPTELIGELRSGLPPAFYHSSGDAHVFIIEKSYPVFLNIAYYMSLVILEFSSARRCRIRIVSDCGVVYPRLLNDILEIIERICQSHGWQFEELDHEVLK
ncbi:MAG: hypothetical protein A4E42_01573 [Methanoregulaceae archaeon PtaU1.Bin222]|nr:MAG: hypothetical protein A4E42_01573 [Methanoregulaceae archaeon PtaU1.Bin222]